MERHNLLALSTAHLTEEEFEIIATNHCLPVRHMGHDYGGLIVIQTDVDLKNYDWKNVPNLKPIVEYCCKEDIRYVDFDRDVEPCDEFTQFDW